MKIKKFEAIDMRDALRMVKQEFGPDAVILSVKKIENGKGIFGLGRSRGIEVTAATDTNAFENKKLSSSMGKTEDDKRSNKYEINDVYQSSKKANFIADVKGYAVGAVSNRNNQRSNSAKFRKELFGLYSQLIDQEVGEDIALDLIFKIQRNALDKSGLELIGIREHFIKVLLDSGISCGRVKLEKCKQKIVAIIGTTGVGKTTTVAKLAAYAKSNGWQKNIGLITLDNNKIGAIEQLRIFSSIIGVPLNVASSNSELRRAIEMYNNCSLILIDTPGFCQNNTKRITELLNILEGNKKIEKTLVMSAVSSRRTNSDIVTKFAGFNTNRVIFTKIDEATNFGGVLSQLYQSTMEMSYFTKGQEIPEDIEVATVERLADMIIGDSGSKMYLSGSPEEIAGKIAEFENKLTNIGDKNLNHNDNALMKRHDYSNLKSASGRAY
ncbi:putative Flagellar biosynthesis protein FlhF [uncultured Desulfobacterium sp.]|uniref:Flagellar biosynthesis protein FlhF n=1 Tax=uncultured Desulfobacterium sp. TaxID=201089 RepID=A0A445MT80_9BACT|nr:putative Flagellar biosynthesis protein FlhF [uncultured Desulfobacterium sp.]